MPADTITIKDNRTDKTYELSIQEETIRALDLRKIKTGDEDFGLMTYDPAYTNTTSCKSRITFIDGDKGILNYRGYPIEQLAESSSYLETAYLLRNGELPTAAQLDAWTKSILAQWAVPSFIEGLIESFPVGSHPMGIFISALGALSIPIEREREQNFGARGLATSAYIRDPDGNVVEIRTYLEN